MNRTLIAGITTFSFLLWNKINFTYVKYKYTYVKYNYGILITKIWDPVQKRYMYRHQADRY